MSTGIKLFVGGLSWDTTEDMLRDRFSDFGPVTFARVITDRETGNSRGFGFVEFGNQSDADAAIEGSADMEIDGRMVRVDTANERQPRQDRDERPVNRQKRDDVRPRDDARPMHRDDYERDRGGDRDRYDRRDRNHDDRRGYDRERRRSRSPAPSRRY